jgi:hypothetical protein
MLLGLLGDLHGDFEAMERAFAREPGTVAWLSVGDIASDAGGYPEPSRPFLFIKGNNEDFDVIARLAAGERVAEHLHFVPNGRRVDIPSLESQAPSSEDVSRHPAPGPRHSFIRVAGLGGTFAPKWYDTPPGELPALARRTPRASCGEVALPRDPSPRSAAAAKADDKRRHFVRAEVEACLALTGVDLFLTHEAPRPYWLGTGRRRNDAGKAVVNEILASMRPRLHVFGHHHRFGERVCEGVPSVGLPLAADGYLVLETEGWTWAFHDLAT